MRRKINTTGLCWLWLSLLVLVIDHLTKWSAQAYLQFHVPQSICKFFNLYLAYNKGAAFSFLDQGAPWQSMLFGLISVSVSLVLIVWLSRLSKKQYWLNIALALVIGGALGNLLDRLLYGHVIDFLDFYVGHLHWPTFNFADSAICIGAVMLIWDSFKQKK